MLSGQRYFIKKPIALIGFMGSGKSSVAKLLSEYTGINYVDTDKEIVQRTRQTVSEIINNDGEAKFRKLEAEVLTDIIENNKCIIATGGGCVESAISRGALKNCYCIWLKVNSKIAADRIKDFQSRPMFKDAENAYNLLQKRDEVYHQYSDWSINTNKKSISDVVNEIKQQLINSGVLVL